MVAAADKDAANGDRRPMETGCTARSQGPDGVGQSRDLVVGRQPDADGLRPETRHRIWPRPAWIDRGMALSCGAGKATAIAGPGA